MRILSCSFFLIFVPLISKGQQNIGDFGPYMCYYFGGTDYYCGDPLVPACTLPTECTSFLWTGTTFGQELDYDDSIYDSLWQIGKPVFATFNHASSIKTYDYARDNIETVAKKDAKFIEQYKYKYKEIKGIILDDVDIKKFRGKFELFQERFSSYLNHMKNAFPELLIGITLNAGHMIQIQDEGLKYSAFDKYIHFYILRFDVFNKCEKSLFIGGIVPLNGDKPHTLTKLKETLKTTNIATTKIIFKYDFYAFMSNTISVDSYMQCEFSYQRMCKNPKDANDWCTETLATLAEKGKFAHENGIAFAADSLDFDDYNGNCECGKKYPSFYSLVDGWNGKTGTPCPKFDNKQG